MVEIRLSNLFLDTLIIEDHLYLWAQYWIQVSELPETTAWNTEFVGFVISLDADDVLQVSI